MRDNQTRAILPPMRKILSKLTDLIDLRDTFVFGGLIMLGYGIAQVYPPAAWITIGGILFLLGVRG